MQEQNLFFNILTFDWPKQPVTFYFHEEEQDTFPRIHRSLFPKQIADIFPQVATNPAKEFISCAFTGEAEGFTPLDIDFKTDNPDLIKRFYNKQIGYYFRKVRDKIVKVGFIKENQIWLPAPKESNAQYSVYDKYTLKVQLCTVSGFPEIHLSYDGKSRVSKKSIAVLIQDIAPENFNWVLYESQLWKYETLDKKEDIDYKKAYPVLGRRLKTAMGFPAEAPPRHNRYTEYLRNIEKFYKDYLDTDAFRELIPLHTTGFLPVNTTRLNYTSPDSNKLAFGTGQDIVPFNGVKTYGPFKKAPYNKVHLFFIVHRDDIETAKRLKTYFQTGLKFFKGLFDFSNCSRSRFYYKKKMPAKDVVIREAIQSVMGSTRKGRNKIIRLVKKLYPQLGSSKIRRVYVKEGFSLTRKMRRRIKNNPANPIMIPLQRNEEWAIDFMCDVLQNGRRFRTLNVVDHFNRECLSIVIDLSFPARKVTALLDRLIERFGKPRRIRTDNGPEFTSKWFQLWLKQRGIAWSAIPKGAPLQNAIVERFNRTYREDVLDANLFASLDHARELTEKWVWEYNHEREHESLNYQTPIAYAA